MRNNLGCSDTSLLLTSRLLVDCNIICKLRLRKGKITHPYAQQSDNEERRNGTFYNPAKVICPFGRGTACA